MANASHSSAFWLQHGATSTDRGSELDIYENCGNSTKDPQYNTEMPSGYHYFTSDWSQDDSNISLPDLGFNTAADYHVYGMQWSKTSLKWYVDGKLIKQLDNIHNNVPEYLIMDTEAEGDWFGLPTDAQLPSHYSIDYIRVWTSNKPSFSISDIPDNTLKLGDDFFDMNSAAMSDPKAVTAIASLLKDGDNKNKAFFKSGGKWYNPFGLSIQQYLNPGRAMSDSDVAAITGFNKWYKSGDIVLDLK
jgi:beta-glucanase (GH16 family)